MGDGSVSRQRVIPVPASEVHTALADYRQVRPALLPAAYTDYAVESGGVGAGTRFRYRLHAGRRVREVVAEVTEPQPGALEERDTGSSLVTRWTVADAGAGKADVRVDTTWAGAGGLPGFFERTFAPLGLGRIYDQILERLAARLADR